MTRLPLALILAALAGWFGAELTAPLVIAARHAAIGGGD